MFAGRNPEKLEAKALDYERRGKTAKALKYREKAAKIRGQNAPLGSTTTTTSTTQTNTFGNRGVQRYEQNALKWEQRGNWNKAQKNREKVWRLQNPQYGSQYAAPMFYNNQNQFLGYNLPYNAQMQQGQQGFQQGQQGQQGFQQGQQGFQQGQQGFQQGQQGFQQGQQGFQQGQQGFQQGQQGFQQGQQGTTTRNVLPATVETHMHNTIVQQTTRPERIVEVQPVVHRQVDAPQVHLIEKHVYETVPSTGPGVITNQPIIQETIRPRVIEEIQPVVHRQVPAPFLERVEQHVTEHITQPTTMTKEVINDTTMRTAPVGLAAGGPLQGGQGGMTGMQGGMPGGMQQGGMQQGGMQQGGMQQGGMTGMQGGMQSGMQQGGMQQGSMGGMQSGTQQNMPNTAARNNNLPPTSR